MRITDAASITELARLLQKSRPTVYKYISEYENGNTENIPESVKTLFVQISENDWGKSKIYEYCHEKYYVEEKEDDRLAEIITLIKNNINKLDLQLLRDIIVREIEK